jgi:SOS-response transcriptional repressor LexA
MTTPALTRNQQAALDYIKRFKHANGGDSPSVREIMEATPYMATSAVLAALNALETYGHITRPKDGKSRRINVVGGRWEYEPVEQEIL